MAKKNDFAAAAAGSTDVFAAIAGGGANSAANITPAENETDENSNTDNSDNSDFIKVKRAKGRPSKGGMPDGNLYRFTVRLDDSQRRYLQEAAFRQSNPYHVVSLSEYVVNLIEEDRAKYERKQKKAEKASQKDE